MAHQSPITMSHCPKNLGIHQGFVLAFKSWRHFHGIIQGGSQSSGFGQPLDTNKKPKKWIFSCLWEGVFFSVGKTESVNSRLPTIPILWYFFKTGLERLLAEYAAKTCNFLFAIIKKMKNSFFRIKWKILVIKCLFIQRSTTVFNLVIFYSSMWEHC